MQRRRHNKTLMHRIAGMAALILLCFLPQILPAQKVYVLELMDEVHSSSARYISRGFEEAHKANAELVIIHLDTYGGRVDFADSIRSDILDANMPTAVFIDRNAGSAGAVISIACDSIFMAPGASIGAATVVISGTKEAAPDKYQSYWRGVMRTTAELKGRDPRIAEKMVDQNLDLPGISPAGQVITFSTKEAIEHNYCDQEANNLKEVAAFMGVENAEITVWEGSAIDKAIIFLVHPSVSGFLILLIFGGLFMEMKTPGVGFAGAVALLGIALFFAPHYIEGLAESWELAIFILGVLLIALEIFVVPGFGVPGILGIICVVAGISVALIDNNGFVFDQISIGDILRSVALVLVMLTTSILLVVWLAKQFLTSSAAYPFVDTATQDKEEGYTAFDQEILNYVGREGVAVTDLRPSGYIEIDGKQLDAEAKEGYINKGGKVIVESVRSINLIVRKA